MSDRQTALLPTQPLLATAFYDADRSLAFGIRAVTVVFVASVTAAAAQISVPLWFTPVPFTLQPMVVLIGGAVLGPRLGPISQLLYLTAGAAGLPVFAASSTLPQGVARLFGPTGGYLLAYPLAAMVTGWLATRGFDRRYLTSVFAMIAGLAVVFAGGVTWLAVGYLPPSSGRVDLALQIGFYPFVIADVAKVCLAAAVLPAVWQFTGLGRGNR
jgi:biotin transport system substrate-specific component